MSLICIAFFKIITGYLAEPAEKYPNVFPKGTIFYGRNNLVKKLCTKV